MSYLLTVSLVSVILNLGLLLGVGYIWVGNYRRHGAVHTLALSIFAGFLFVQNIVWLYLYGVNQDYIDWFVRINFDLQLMLTSLCVLETAALVFLAWITLR